MNVSDVLAVGAKGSGKTTLLRHLYKHTRRGVAFDVTGHDYRRGAVVHSFGEFRELYERVRGDAFQIRVRARAESDRLRILRLVWWSQRHEGLPPVGLFIDEARVWGTKSELPPVVADISSEGRHYNVNVAWAVQRDTQLATDLRSQSTVVVALRGKATGPLVREVFEAGQRDRIRTLRVLKPSREVEPRNGVHYLTVPEGVDVLDAWAASQFSDRLASEPPPV